jgi:hypothetical protein
LTSISEQHRYAHVEKGERAGLLKDFAGRDLAKFSQNGPDGLRGSLSCYLERIKIIFCYSFLRWLLNRTLNLFSFFLSNKATFYLELIAKILFSKNNFNK